MSADVATGLALILTLGGAAQWAAWRLRLPAILFLLGTGIAAGPVLGILDPDRLFSDALLPLASVAVALILFEGGLSLHLSEIRKQQGTLIRLVTLGALVTWLTAAAAGHYFLGLPPAVSLLLGATLVVTGPTVIGPLLRHIRPTGPAAGLLKWEGIVIDPVGATLALLVFEAVAATASGEVTTSGGVTQIALIGIAKTIAYGCSLGAAAAGLVYIVIRRYWVPDFLQVPVTLALVVGSFSLSEHLQHESGFLTVTVMGALLGNQKRVSIAHLLEFKENLRTLLISSLFILLSARMDFGVFEGMGLGIVGFLLVLVLVVRPLSVWLSTIGSGMKRPDRLFLAWMAPRGIVAAAVSSVFALKLEAAGFQSADQLVSVTFAVIIATVALYGLTALPIARKLGVAGPKPQGIFILGAHAWARSLAKKLGEYDFRVLLADTNRDNIRQAKMDGLQTWAGNALHEAAVEGIDFGGIGRLMSLTPNDDVNRLAALHFAELFGRGECYRLADPDEKKNPHETKTFDAAGRIAFEGDMDHPYLEKRWALGARFRGTKLSEEFDYDAFQKATMHTARLLFVIREGELLVNASDRPLTPKFGDVVITLADPEEENAAA